MNQRERTHKTLFRLLIATAILAPCSKASMDDMNMDMMMPMYFWKGEKLYWLSRHLQSTTAGEYAAGLIVTFLFGLVLQALNWMRNYVYIKSQIRAV